jgi:amidase
MSASDYPNRRRFLQAGLLSGVAAVTDARADGAARSAPSQTAVKPFELDEKTITELQEMMRTGKHSARSLTEMYLARIKAIDREGPSLRSVIEENPDAMAMAEACDKERQAKRSRGPLHGIPVLVKDNIDTTDRMATTAGSLALVGARPPEDAFVVQRLRQCGAVILGKTNLSEWANFRSSNSTSGWSGRGGLTKNPYAFNRNCSGSSSGSGAAVAANLCAVAVGTETDGSILSPSSVHALVGIKPTVGLVSRTGIIPISHSQDTAGPMARSVRDAAILLTVLAAVDPNDKATAAAATHIDKDYSRHLDAKGLQGARIGVARKLYFSHDGVEALMEDALQVMRQQGATVIDPADIPTTGQWDESELTLLLYEFKAGLNAYLARLGPKARVRSLKDIIAFNEKERKREMPHFGQDLFLKAETKGALTSPEYQNVLERCRRLTREEGIDAVMEKHKLDALVAPTEGPAWVTDYVVGDHSLGHSTSPPAIAGYPSITVPAGRVAGLPVGLSFFGRAWSEPVLIKLAYAFEQATNHRRPPQFLETVP